MNARDAESEMVELAGQLSARVAAGEALPKAAQLIADILWIDTMVSPNGFDGWLYETSCERIVATREALDAVGCSRVADIVGRALEIGKVAPESMTDDERQSVLDDLPDEVRDQLSELDDEYFEAKGECMITCREFVRVHKADFRTSE